MGMRKRLLLGTGILAMLLVCVGCSPSEERAARGQELRLNLKEAPTHCDPRQSIDYSSAALAYLCYEGLTRLDTEGKPTWALAENVEISDSGKHYLFHLKKSSWSNGDPLTAYDFERSWKEQLSPTFPCASAHLLY